jgi:L-glyceraldehyde 3-phosphate reductase
MLTEANLDRVRGLREIAARRGQSVAQYALAWALRDPRMTSLVIGASGVAQLDENLDALENLDITDDELAETDGYAEDAGINLWSRSSDTPSTQDG